MTMWVKNLVTGEKWILDDDETKPVYQKGDNLHIELSDISKIRFFPCDPDIADVQQELSSFGHYHQNTIFDY